MTDAELIDYCKAHAQTERALFHKSHVDRMLALAEVDSVFKLPEWGSYKQSMINLCDRAKEVQDAKVKC